MRLFVFTDADRKWLELSELLLSVVAIDGGGVATFAYVIATLGAYLVNIGVMTSNRQVLR